MMNNTNKLNGLAYRTMLLVAFLLLSGCASSLMKMTPTGLDTPQPDKENALVVFLRPSSFGGAIQSVVFDTTKDTKAIGVVSVGTKIPYLVKPGKIELMVISENADFLKGTLEAGKTYYVLVKPRFGVLRTRFSLGAITQEQLSKPEAQKWISDGKWHTPIQEKFNLWVAKNTKSIEEKRIAYHKKWDTKAEKDKPTLLPQDGLQ